MSSNIEAVRPLFLGRRSGGGRAEEGRICGAEEGRRRGGGRGEEGRRKGGRGAEGGPYFWGGGVRRNAEE